MRLTTVAPKQKRADKGYFPICPFLLIKSICYFRAPIIMSSILIAASGITVPGPNIAIAPAL